MVVIIMLEYKNKYIFNSVFNFFFTFLVENNIQSVF